MKIIERSEFYDEEGVISLENRIRGTFKHGLNWYGLMQAQEVATRMLSKSLEKEHVLLRNVTIPGTSIIIPMILISPQGARVIDANPIGGVFRAKGEDWMKFDGRSRTFKRTRPNLQTEVEKKSKFVHRYLNDQGYPLPDVEAVLLFTNPRGHIDSARPRVRIVQVDAVDHFVANMTELPPIMDQEDIALLTEALINPRSPEPEPEIETEIEPDPPAEPELAPDMLFEMDETITTEHEGEITSSKAKHRVGGVELARRQWILLAVITFFEIVILIIFAMLIIRDFVYT